MLAVNFITSEANRDLLVTFSIASFTAKCLTVQRSPFVEVLLPKEARGASIVPLNRRDVARDLLVSIKWFGSKVTIRTQRYRYRLDVSAVPASQIAEAKAVLREMVIDGTAEMNEG